MEININKKVIKIIFVFLILMLFINISDSYAVIDTSTINQTELEHNKDYMAYIFSSLTREKVLNVYKILGVISIVLIFKAFKMQKDTKVLKRWIAIYMFYIFSIVMIYMVINQSLSIDAKHFSYGFSITVCIVTLIVRIITIIYPMYIIIKNKKESLKGDK